MTVQQQPPQFDPENRVVYIGRRPQPWSGGAITSFVLSLVWFWGLGSLIAVILGHAAARECKDGSRRGETLRQWGVALGYFGMILTALLLVAVANAGPDYSSTYSTPSYGSSYLPDSSSYSPYNSYGSTYGSYSSGY